MKHKISNIKIRKFQHEEAKIETISKTTNLILEIKAKTK